MGRRFQSALGTEFQRRYKEGQQIDTISLMSVTKVNYKYNTVDLIAVKHKETFTASYENEGKYSAKLPMEFGGRNIAGQPYGQINPITVGTLVLVGFIESDKNNPIILGVYARNDVNEKLARAPFASADPTDESLAKQMYQKYTLYPSLTYDSVDGDGTRVTSFSGKSFMIFDTTPNTNATMISDGNYGTSYEDLSTSFYNDGEVIEPMSGLAPNILFKHQGVLDSNEDPDDHQFMIHIASDGTYRTSQMKQGEDWRTMFEMDTEGQVRLRRQGDTIRLDDGVEIGEILIDKYGIVSLRNGETDLEVRKDGLYSKGKPLGEAIGGDIDLSDIYDKLGEIDTSIAFANTQITNINGEVKVVSEKTTVIDGQVKEMEASVSIMADKIETKVSSTQVEEMIDDSLSEFNKDIQKIKAEAEKANAVIADMANDNRLTPQEKTQLLAEWEIINSEYPSYINQANIYEVKSDAYTEAYEKLGDFVKPLLDKMEDTSVVDGVTMRKLFQTYYNERTALLSSVLKGLKDGITEAMKKAGDAQLDATTALADSAQAQIDANKANSLITDIASDGKLTPSEKSQLKKEWDIIVKDYPKTIEQATKYKVNTDEFTLKYNALKNVVDPLLADLTTTSIVNGQVLRDRMAEYYASKTQVLKDISDLAQDVMNDYGNRISTAETSIKQTSESISLLATKVETIGKDVESNKAELKIQADQISQKVTASQVKDVVKEAIDDIQVGGTNLYVIFTQTKGWLSDTDGTVGAVVDNSVVSNYIKVRETSPYVASLFNNTGTNTIVVCWYDTDRKFISGESIANTGDFSQAYKSPAKAVYARVSYKKAPNTLMKFESGTKATDFSYAWDDIKNDQMLLQTYIKEVEEQAKKAQTDADDAKNNADLANKQIDDMANDNIVTPTEKQQLLLQWEEVKTEYPLNLDQASKFGVTSTNYTNSYKALETYLTPILADMTKSSAIIGSTLRSTFKSYFDRKTTLLNSVAEIAKTLATNAQGKADQLDDDMNNIGGYNYVGFSSGDDILPRLMIKNLGYYSVYNSVQDFADNMVSIKQKTAGTWFGYDVGTTDNNKFSSLADFRMKEVKEGQWITVSSNLQVFGTGSVNMKIYLYNDGWKESSSKNVKATDGVTRVVSQQKVASNTTGILVRFRANDSTVTEFRFGNVQVEVGIRATPWKKSDIDISEDINNTAQKVQDDLERQLNTAKEEAKADYNNALSQAQKAQTNADKANQSISDLSNDNLVTPSEKLDLKKEWEIIVAEKPVNDTQATKFGVSNTAYTTAYTALNNYLTPILADLTTNSTIVGQTMRDTFKAYYTARTNLLNAVSVKAKELADNAQTDADTAQTNADKALEDANKAQNDIDNLTIGGTNIIQVTQIEANKSGATSATVKSYDEKTGVYTIVAPATSTSIYGAGLTITSSPKKTLIPWGATYIVSFEIKVPKASSWNVGVNNYLNLVADSSKTVDIPVTGIATSAEQIDITYKASDPTPDAVTADNDDVPKRKASSKTLDPDVWVKCWFSYVNTNAKNTDKLDLYDASFFGIVMTGETKDMEYQIRNVKGELGTRPTEWSPAPEDVQEQLNGKEGTWIYQPTAPSSPSVGLVWVNTTETPYQPRRYTGVEEGWVPLTPEEVSDLPWGEDGSNLADWVSQAEQKIQADSIINTVLGSNDFTTIFDGKANAEDLNNLANYDDLEAMRAEYERLLQQGLDGIDFTPYVTQSELTQLKDSFNFSIQQAGGVNMVKNSLGYQGTEFWDDGQNTNLLRNSNFDVGDGLTYWNKGSGSTIADAVVQPDGGMHVARWQGSASIKWLGIQQAVYQSVNTGDEITVSFYAKAYSGKTAKPYIGIHWRDQSSAIVDQSWQTATSISATLTRFSLTFTCPRDNISAVNIMFYAESNTDFDIGYTRVKAELGSVATEWTPNPNDFSANQWIQTIANEDLATLGFGSGFLFNNHASAYLRQPVQLPEVKTGLQYGFSFYMSVYDDASPVKVNAGARIIENNTGVVTTVGLTDLSTGIPAGYNRYAIVFEPSSADITIELFVEQGDKATVVISGIMLNIGNLALKWQPFPSEIYNTNVRIDINGITVKNNQTDGYTMITPQEFSGYAKVDNVMERIFTLNGQVTEVKMLRAEERITMEPITIFAMNTTNNRGWAFVGALPESDN